MNLKGIIYAILAAFCFGIMPILTKLLYGATGVDPFFFLMIRYTLAAIILWSYLLIRRDNSWREVDGRSLGVIAAASASYIVVTATYFIALKYIDASLNSLLVFTFPIFTPFLGALFFRMRIHSHQVFAAVVAFLGCLLLIGNCGLKGGHNQTLGVILGLVAGLLYAVYTLFGQKLTVRLAPVAVTAFNLSIVTLFFLVQRVHWLWTRPQNPQVYLIAGIIAVVSTILANVFYFESIRTIGAVKAGIFSSFEPLFTTMLAIPILGERLSLIQWFGASFILGGMIIVQKPWATKDKEKLETIPF